MKIIKDEKNGIITRVYEKGDKPQKLYGNYTEAGYNNTEECFQMLRSAIETLSKLKEEGKAERILQFQLVIKDETIGWKAAVEEKEV